MVYSIAPSCGLRLVHTLETCSVIHWIPARYAMDLNAEERLRLIDRCDRLLAVTDQGLAGPFNSHDFEQSAGKVWQQDLFRSEEIPDLSELKEQLTGAMSDDSIFHNGAWTRAASRSEYWIDETCQELREMSFTNTAMPSHLWAASSRDSTAWTSYDENEEIFWKPFRARSVEQQFPGSPNHRHQESRQAHVQITAGHWSLDEVHADGDEEERADIIWSVSQGALFYQQQLPEEQPCHISSSTRRRHGEADRQQAEKHQPDRGRPERQKCDRQRPERGRYDGQQRHEHPQSKQHQNAKQEPLQRQRDDRQLFERQKVHKSGSDTQPESECPHAISEASVLDNWKLLLLALNDLNSRMTVEEVKTVEQLKEGREAFQNPGTDEFFTPGHVEGTEQTLRLTPPSEGPMSDKPRNVSAQFHCTVASPYWEWDSVSPTISFSSMAVTESIQQAPDQIVLIRWMTKNSRTTLLEYVGRLCELHRRLSNEPDKSRLICKPMLEWMSRNKIGDTSKSRARSNELKIVLAGRERARAQMLSASKHRVRFAL